MSVGITVYLRPELLTKIEKNIAGKNRATKIRKCVEVGYDHLVTRNRQVLSQE